MTEFTQLNRQFIAWFGSLPPQELLEAYGNYAYGTECEDRFFDGQHHALIHSETRGMPGRGEFRLGQSMVDEYVLTPSNGKVIVRKIGETDSIEQVFSSVNAFLVWMLDPSHHSAQMALAD